VALLRAEKKTGIVMDENLSFAMSDDQKVYTVFESLEKAKLCAVNFLRENPDIEIAIYSNTEEVLYDSNPIT
jgi:hypothetical protein